MPTIYLRNRTREQIALPAVPPFIMGDLNNPSTSLADVILQPNETKTFSVSRVEVEAVRTSLNRLVQSSIIQMTVTYEAGEGGSGGQSTPTTRTVNHQTGTAYQLALTDESAACALVLLDNANPITVTVPLHSTTAFEIGATVHLQQIGSGQVEFAPEGAVVLNPASTLKISAQWKSVSLVQVEEDVWSLIGSLSA